MLLKPAMAAAAAARAGLSSGRPRAWLPVLLLCGAAIGALWYVVPRAPRNPLYETTVWSLLVVMAFAGWGSLVRFAAARTERIDLDLRVVWGAAALCTVGRLLAVFAAMTRGAVFVLVESGIALALGSAVLERVGVTVRVRALRRSLRRDPGLALVSAAVIGVLALTYLAGISDTHTNPYDDDIAYLAFVRKMLDTGTVLEPFSLRRLSAFGGQTFFLELVAVRAAPSQAHTFDRSIALLMVVLLLVGHRTKTRRLPAVVTLLAVTFFLILPNLSINTASYWSEIP